MLATHGSSAALALVNLVNPTFLFRDISAAPHRRRSRVGLSVTSDTMRTARVRPRPPHDRKFAYESGACPLRWVRSRCENAFRVSFHVHYKVDARASR